MKFFIPGASDAAQTDRVYKATREFVSRETAAKLSDRRVYRIHGIHNGKEFRAQVGDSFERLQEHVVAILFDAGRNLYYVCTPNRGVIRGEPYLVGADEAGSIEDFEQDEPSAR
jgi:hypothetical protein